jgi:nucleotide-binding universal stress UspA family protein
MAVKRILVPVDFSDDSLKALVYARDFAKPFGAEFAVLHVIEPIYYATPADMYATSPNIAMFIDEQRRIGMQQLARIGADLKKKGERVRTLLKTGSAAQCIVDTAKSIKADMIVISTHGRTGFVHMLMGSVAEKVVRTAGCPVLTVRAAAMKKAARKKRAKRG